MAPVLLFGGNGWQKIPLNNMETRPFSINARLRSFLFAWQGLRRFILSEHNTWIHVVATIAVILMARFYPVTHYEAIALTFSIGMVWITEVLNTAIEKMMDRLAPGPHPMTGYIKDLAAGAVLLAAITAVITGLIVFIPKL